LRRSSCALTLLIAVAVAGCAHPVDPSVVDPFDVLREKLAQTVSVDWDNVPLETALAELGERAGVAIHFDRQALEAGGALRAEPVTLHVQGIRLRSVLHLICDDTDWAFQSREDAIWVTSDSVADNLLTARLYDVADLTRDQQSFDETALAATIKEIVGTDRWEDAGGAGTIDVRPAALLVKQTYDVHLQIADLLDQLAAGRNDTCASRAGAGGPESMILAALNSRLTVDLNRPADVVLREIQAKHGINVVLKGWRTPAEAEEVADALKGVPGKPMALTDVTVRDVLDLMLEPLGLGWTMRSDVLMVTPRDYTDASLSVRTYRIPAEINVQRTEWYTTPAIGGLGSFYPGSQLLTNEFTDNLKHATRFSSWRDSGGVGWVAPLSARIVVAQTQRGHDELVAWLDQWERATDPRVLDYDERDASPQAKRLWEALERPLTVKFAANQCSLREGLDQLCRPCGVTNVVIDEPNLADANVTGDIGCPAFEAAEVSLAAALTSLLDSLGANWFVRDNLLIVTSKEQADTTLFNRTYRCSSLPTGDAETMIGLVTQFVRPDSWADAGGPGWGVQVVGNVLCVTQTCEGHRAVRQFLRQWQAVHDAAPGRPLLVAAPAEQRVHDALDNHVTLPSEDLPLIAAVAELARQAGLGSVDWDWKHIEELLDSKDLDNLRRGQVRGTFKADDERASDALTRLLRPYGLSWLIAHDRLCVTVRDVSETYLVDAFYKLPPSLIPVAGKEASLIDLVKSQVNPESWSSAGGPAQIEFVAGNFVIVQTYPMQAQVWLFLRQLEAALDRPTTGPRLILSAVEQQYYNRLQQAVTYAAKDEPLLGAIERLAKKSGIDGVLWDWDSIDRPEPSALAEELRSGTRRVTFEAADEPLADVLTRALRPHNLWWTISRDAVCVSSVQQEQPLVTGFYPLPAEALAVLTPHLSKAPDDPPDLTEQCLLELVKEACQPETWTDSGGAGEVRLFPAANGKHWIVVSNRLGVHPSVGQFLNDLQKNRKLQDELPEKLKDIQEWIRIPVQEYPKPVVG
jgi:hypothetical protein